MTIVTIKCRNTKDGEHKFKYDTEMGIVIGIKYDTDKGTKKGTAIDIDDVISRQMSDDSLNIPTKGIYIVTCPICGTENRVIIS